jgi:hypothetical protein
VAAALGRQATQGLIQEKSFNASIDWARHDTCKVFQGWTIYRCPLAADTTNPRLVQMPLRRPVFHFEGMELIRRLRSHSSKRRSG